MTRPAATGIGIGMGRVVAPAAGFVDWCVELLSPLGAVRAKAMFGGHGLYVDEGFVGLIAVDRLYLKADAISAPNFEAAGCVPFVYSARGKSTTMSFWSVPAEAMDSPADMASWGTLAMQAAARARAKAGPSRARQRTALNGR